MPKPRIQKRVNRPQAKRTKCTRRAIKKAAKTISKKIASGKRRFIKELRQCSSVILAAERANLARRTVYQWREADTSFAEVWDDTLTLTREDLRVSIHEEAVKKDGNTTLKIFVAKSYFPEFREKAQLEENPEVKRIYLGLAQILRRHVPRERLRDAVIDFCALTGYDAGADPRLISGPAGNGSAGAGDNQRDPGHPEEGDNPAVLEVDRES